MSASSINNRKRNNSNIATLDRNELPVIKKAMKNSSKLLIEPGDDKEANEQSHNLPFTKLNNGQSSKLKFSSNDFSEASESDEDEKVSEPSNLTRLSKTHKSMSSDNAPNQSSNFGNKL